MRLFRLAALSLLPAAALLPGCASLLHGRSDTVTVTTEPAGARVLAVGEGRINSAFWIGDIGIPDISSRVELEETTPATLQLTKRHDWVLLIEKPGYRRAVVPVHRQFDPALLLNVFNLFLFAWIDLHLGCDGIACENDFHVKLTPLAAPKAAPPPDQSPSPSPTATPDPK